MFKSSVKEIWKPTAYNKRDILNIDGKVSTWTAEDIKKELEHNRLLQQGFATRSPLEIIADVQCAQHLWPWLIDFVCPKLEHAVRINIAARVITSYTVVPHDLAEVTEQIYQTLDMAFFEQARKQIDALMAPLRAKTENEWLDFYQSQKDKDGRPKFSDLEKGNKLLAAMIRIRLDQAEHQISNNLLTVELKAHCARLKFIISPKPLMIDPTTYMVLGAPGSGKSNLLANKQLNECDVIIVSVDNYRAIQFKGIDSHLSNEQVFIKTQDTAYWIKERVTDILINEIMTSASRPHLIIDGMSIYPWMQEIIDSSKTEVLVACVGVAKEIPFRVWKRAEDPKARIGDKNRHINTSLLLQIHSYGSDILANVPKHNNIVLYNTHTPDHVPIRIATLNTVNNTMVIDDLKQTAQFLGKRKLNAAATSPSELFTHTQFKTDRFQFTARHQASCILSLLKPHPSSKVRDSLSTLSLKKKEQEYARIEKDERGQLRWVVSDLTILQEQLNDKNDKTLILELLVQTSSYNDKRSYLGNKVVYKKVMEEVMRPIRADEQAMRL
jgi:adenylate kinase family enzyme